MMKKLLALTLCLLMAVPVFAGCQAKDGDDKGAIIPVYLTTEISNFDPAYANLDDASMQVLSLIYEGLFTLDKNGKPVKAQAKNIKVLDKPNLDYYAIEITLQSTKWSDGTLVQAADYIYAWKRILESEFRGEAASLLFDIKNARAVHDGDMSIDDLGVSDVERDVLRIEFEGKTDYNKFYEYLASPMLVPLRENVIDKVSKDWSSNPAILVSNGPFVVRVYSQGEQMVLERNMYYRRNVDKDSLFKYVTPYRLVINFNQDVEENLAALEAGSLVYDANLPLEKRAEYLSADKVKVTDTMSVMSFLFNTKVAPFDNPKVRKALSLALDRNEIASLLTFAKPAAGLIADGVFNTKYSSKAVSFREAGEALLSAEANLSEARSLLSSAGVSGGDITLTVRNNEADLAVAAYAEDVWESLGFEVTVEKKRLRKYLDEKEYDLVADTFADAYDAGDFEVILIDYTMFSTDAFANLAMFSKNFAGAKINTDISSEDFELSPHISGYNSEAYDAKIEEAFAARADLEARAALLHEAEALLLSDMPIVPLVQLQTARVIGSDLKNVSTNYWGFDLFAAAKLNHREKYETVAAE